MEVKVDRKALGWDDDRHILIPIGTARLNGDKHDVLIERLPAQGLAGAPAYKRGKITRDYETSLRNYYGATTVSDAGDYYKDDLYDDTKMRTRRQDSALDAASMPRLGDNEVTVPLVADQEIIVRRPGSDDEIVIRKSRANDEARD